MTASRRPRGSRITRRISSTGQVSSIAATTSAFATSSRSSTPARRATCGRRVRRAASRCWNAPWTNCAFKAGIDPLTFRRLNYASKDADTGKEFTSKSLEACYREGAELLGWSEAAAQPRRCATVLELVGSGMASGVWEAMMMKTQCKAVLTSDGRLSVSLATSDIGIGHLYDPDQIAAEAFGLPLESVTVRMGDLDLPAAPVEGGSWGAASGGSAVQAACQAVQKTLFAHAAEDDQLAAQGCGL